MLENIQKSLDRIESDLAQRITKAEGQLAESGKVSQDLLNEIEGIGNRQRELADELLKVQQTMANSGTGEADEAKAASWGFQIVKSDAYGAFKSGTNRSVRHVIKNTIVGADATVAPDRRVDIVGGAFDNLTLEGLFTNVPTTSNAIEYTREATFVNNAAAQNGDGNVKAETDITFSLESVPVATIAHFTKISRQLAQDNAALAAYVDSRLRYGVNRKVESQIVVGNGLTGNLSGILKVGNYVAHGYQSANVGNVLTNVVLIRKTMGDLAAAGYPADTIVLNPVDWAGIEVELVKTAAGQTPISYADGGQARLWGIPVVTSVGMTAGQFAVGAFRQAGTIHNREEVVVDMTDSDGTDFQRNLFTIRAERRLALAIEVPAAIRGGALL